MLLRRVSMSLPSLETVTVKLTNGCTVAGSTFTPPSAISAFHQVESFLLSLTDANEDGRVLISSTPSADPTISKVTLKYILLNPAEHFKDLVEDARCIVLAGGTMEPVCDCFIM